MPETAATIARLEREFAYLARRLEANSRLRNYPLDRAHYLLLLNLADAPQSISALAAALDLDGSTVTRQVLAMQKRGYVEKRANPADRREALVARTLAGTEAVETMQAERQMRTEALFADWSEEDRKIFANLLARANAGLADVARREMAARGK